MHASAAVLKAALFAGAQIKSGIQGFKEPKPAVVFVTSAGVERNAKIGDDEVARKEDIPIVQLNPGGVLNHKYAGEWALRSAGVPYSVVRSTGAWPYLSWGHSRAVQGSTSGYVEGYQGIFYCWNW